MKIHGLLQTLGLQLRYGFIPGILNPADAPSRIKPAPGQDTFSSPKSPIKRRRCLSVCTPSFQKINNFIIIHFILTLH